jgi:G3E family GTPase
MEVSDYNKGRDPSDVSDKTWIDGTRQYLRPDTIWADDRYVDITQAEINEAKKRVETREAQKHKQRHGKHGHDEHHEHHAYDWQHVAYKQEKPMYP